MTVNVGDRAPDFDLVDHRGSAIRLSAFRGRAPVIVAFFPFALSGLCSNEIAELAAHDDEFDAAGISVLGVTVDSTFALRAWAERENVAFPLLSDFWPHGQTARAYGVFREDVGFTDRVSFLVDASGLVAARVTVGPGGMRTMAEYRPAIEALETTSDRPTTSRRKRP